MPLSTAIFSSGAAEKVSSLLIDMVGSGRPYVLLAGTFRAWWFATALLVVPLVWQL